MIQFFMEFPMVVESIEYKQLQIEKPLGMMQVNLLLLDRVVKSMKENIFWNSYRRYAASLGSSYNPKTHVLEG